MTLNFLNQERKMTKKKKKKVSSSTCKSTSMENKERENIRREGQGGPIMSCPTRVGFLSSRSLTKLLSPTSPLLSSPI